jgi:hypothetical protein
VTTQLSIYNGALRELGENPLTSLTENVAYRHDLDQIWDNGFIDDVLERGLWNFAIRTTELAYTGDINPTFGLTYAFEKPSDWIRTAKLCSDEYFMNPLNSQEVHDEQGYWFSELQTLYLSYVSNDDAYGNNLAEWPQSFVRFAEAYMAFKGAPRIAPKMEKEVFDKQKKFLVEARSRDAMNEGAAIPREGDWTRSRRGRRPSTRIGNSLIG